MPILKKKIKKNLIAVSKFNTWLSFQQLRHFIGTVTYSIPSSEVISIVVVSAVMVTTVDVATLVPENRSIMKITRSVLSYAVAQIIQLHLYLSHLAYSF